MYDNFGKRTVCRMRASPVKYGVDQISAKFRSFELLFSERRIKASWVGTVSLELWHLGTKIFEFFPAFWTFSAQISCQYQIAFSRSTRITATGSRLSSHSLS